MLYYSHHATDRTLSRKLPFLSCLPTDARLADRDSRGRIYKVGDDKDSFFLIVSEEDVITTFRKQDAEEWDRWMHARQAWRHREMQGVHSLYPPTDGPLQEARDTERVACRTLRYVLTDTACERNKTRRARHFDNPHPRDVRAQQLRLLQKARKEGIAPALRAN